MPDFVSSINLDITAVKHIIVIYGMTTVTAMTRHRSQLTHAVSGHTNDHYSQIPQHDTDIMS